MDVRRFALGAFIAAAVALTAGCGGGESSSGKPSEGGVQSVGLVKFSGSDVASEAVFAAFTKAAESRGIDVSTVDPQGSVDKAISGVQNFVQKDVDVIVTAVFEPKTMAGGMAAAKAAGIPVMSLAGGLSAPGVTAYMDTGYLPGVPLAEQVVADMGGKGDLLMLGSKIGMACIGREKALEEKLAGTDIETTRNEIVVSEDLLKQGSSFTQAWLAQHPAGSAPLAIWSCSDDPIMGALSALQSAGRDDVTLLYGLNGTPSALQAIKAGTMRATAAFDIAKAGNDLADLLPSVVKGGVNAKPREFPAPSEVVTTENINEYLKAHPDALG